MWCLRSQGMRMLQDGGREQQDQMLPQEFTLDADWKYPMDLATQKSLVTLANFHVNDHLTPLLKTLKASRCPPEKVASTPASPLTTFMHSLQSQPGWAACMDRCHNLSPVLLPLPGTLSSSQTPVCPSQIAQVPFPSGSLPWPPGWVGWSSSLFPSHRVLGWERYVFPQGHVSSWPGSGQDLPHYVPEHAGKQALLMEVGLHPASLWPGK